MKRKYLIALILLVSVFSAGWVHAQTGKLPPFSMQQANGKVFRAADLPMEKPVLIIYFSPDCDHCNTLMKALLKHTDVLQKASVAMVTYLATAEVTKFNNSYQLSRYPYIYTGTEGSTYFLKNYYGLTSFPFLALYDKNGSLVKKYPNENGLPDVLNQLKKLL